MANDELTPVIIGVGDIKNKSLEVENASEPAVLMKQAILESLKDTNLSTAKQDALMSAVDDLSVVATWTWPYPDLPDYLSKLLKIDPAVRHLSEHGGNSPCQLLDEAARRIAKGETTVAIVTGGEALASLRSCTVAKKMPPPGWPAPDPNSRTMTADDLSLLGTTPGSLHKIGLPIHIYPLYENGFRARRKQSIRENHEESSALYAQFAEVAKENTLAWNHGKAASKEEIGTVSTKNRVICFPYPLLMNAFNTVNLAAACIVTSAGHARSLRIPESKWIYPLSGAGSAEDPDFWKRAAFDSAPAISASIDLALKNAGLQKRQIDLFDFYSHHLGLPTGPSDNPVTLLGGLTSFGGAGNNYSMHALTAMTRELRKGNKKFGLVLANGGVLTHQNVIILAKQPNKGSVPYADQDSHAEINLPIPTFVEKPQGRATIEAYTVQFDRDNKPSLGYIVGRLESGDRPRFIANHGDEFTLAELSSMDKEPIGRRGTVSLASDGRNLFCLDAQSRL
ncbi:hypothetical protein E4T50_09923 [Aureobasidium sp. EXF-12298]|nr:hypothetical protein E4T50_09923 [Aureobasidium sp. EXF-12298]